MVNITNYALLNLCQNLFWLTYCLFKTNRDNLAFGQAIFSVFLK